MAAVPLVASFLPASQRTQTAKSRTAWQAYVATEAGAMHDRCLAQREAHPDTVITPEEALIIVRPLLDPACSLFPVISGPRLARFWRSLQEGDAAKEDILQFFIAAASGSLPSTKRSVQSSSAICAPDSRLATISLGGPPAH